MNSDPKELQYLKTVLVLAPHTDDGEFGCGASLSRLAEAGARIHYVAFSSCRESLPVGLPPDTLKTELKNALHQLQISPEQTVLHDFPVRRFGEHRQAILEILVKLKNELSPDVVFLPSSPDIHQDHNTIHEEGVRAFKSSRLLGYEMPWNCMEFPSRFFVHVSLKHVETKVTALKEYKSQAHRAYASERYIKSLAMTRGMQTGSAEYAECFELLRWFV